MKRLTSKITIGNFSFLGVVDLKIESSWDVLTDICEITIPRKLKFKDREIATGVNPLFKKGDKVIIELGYDDNNSVEFIGYVRHIDAATPITIKCEDSAFLLKDKAKTISYRSVSLKQLLADILPEGMSFEALDVSLGQFRLKDVTPAKVLDELRKTYNLYAFFKGETLYVGWAYPPTKEIITHQFQFEKNIISDELEYRIEEDVKIKVKAISMLPNNEKIEIEVGEADGEIRTFHYYDVQKADLEKLATAEIERLRYSGWFGSFLAFGLPSVQHGEVVELTDNKLDRQGAYFVKKVNIEFGQNGFRRTIYLDRKQ